MQHLWLGGSELELQIHVGLVIKETQNVSNIQSQRIYSNITKNNKFVHINLQTVA